ncbi:AvaI/BsoBI family type II restriction endonuclease [Bacillus wiedmannii]
MVIVNNPPYKRHLSRAEDLKTTYEETRAGFIAFALEKNRRATPYIERARALKVNALSAETPMELLEIPDIQSALLTASGISAKALKYFGEEHQQEAIKGLIENFLEPAGSDFVDELVYRYLLIQGDSLGGSMRNVVGAMAQFKFTRSIISQLEIANIPYKWTETKRKFHDKPEDDFGLEEKVKGLSWTNGDKSRTLLYNSTVPLVSKNIDFCLFDGKPGEFTLKSDDKYLLLGELKGGIDPAGADEHWKTANTALERIRNAFAGRSLTPKTAFIGAAIESAMANEIWEQLENGTMDNVANLTDLDQVSSFCRWLVHL